jgi:DNA-binding transcriptional LysR family regulator
MDLHAAMRLLADTDAMLEVLRQGSQPPSGRLVVSAPVSMTLDLLCAAPACISVAHPPIELEVRLNDRRMTRRTVNAFDTVG